MPRGLCAGSEARADEENGLKRLLNMERRATCHSGARESVNQ